MIILGIETTCDETACSLVKDGKIILSNKVASQADLHEIYGGVYPELACRRHLELIIPIIDEALKEAQVTKDEVDAIAVAYGPGLIGPLLIGVNTAKALAFAWNKPFIGVNHVEAHLYAAMMGEENLHFPALGVVISGGHTFMVKIHSIGHYEMIGTTIDDAIGEAFDKVATLLGLPYPGGPEVEKLALQGNPNFYSFKPGRIKNSQWNFSFSGLKTSVLYAVKGPNSSKNSPLIIPDEHRAHVAASFQLTALGDVCQKAMKATQAFNLQAIYFGGGVSNNLKLRELMKESPVPVFYPAKSLSLDNAAMIAGLGYHVLQKKGESDPLSLNPVTRIPLSS